MTTPTPLELANIAEALIDLAPRLRKAGVLILQLGELEVTMSPVDPPIDDSKGDQDGADDLWGGRPPPGFRLQERGLVTDPEG